MTASELGGSHEKSADRAGFRNGGGYLGGGHWARYPTGFRLTETAPIKEGTMRKVLILEGLAGALLTAALALSVIVGA